MNSRDELGKFFQEHYQTGIGAEVGCYLGDFSKTISKDWKGTILSIDYFDKSDFLYVDNIELKAKKNLEGTSCQVIKGRSVDVAKNLADESLDWVYIDADHRYETAKEDIATWFPKVRKGGIVSGHDYIKDYYVQNIVFGVWKAVDEFCDKNGYKFELIHDTVSGADFASWYFTK